MITEDEWLRKATAAAIAAARRVASDNPGVTNTPAGRLNDNHWGWIITAVIAAWVDMRVQQAISEGMDPEETVRATGLAPEPCDTACVNSILGTLAQKADVDWSLPLRAWSKETMTGFLMLAWELITKAEIARDHGPGKIIRKSRFDPEVGDPIPF